VMEVIQKLEAIYRIPLLLKHYYGFSYEEIGQMMMIKEGTVKDFISNIENNMLRQGDDLRFVLNGTDSNLIYVPHYSQYKERYGIYFNFCSKGNGEE